MGTLLVAVIYIVSTVGVMSLGWMALIAAFIAGEKLLPWPVAARMTVAVLLLLLGLGIVAGVMVWTGVQAWWLYGRTARK